MEAIESECQIMKYEKQTLEQRIDVRKRVKMQEIDHQLQPMTEKRDELFLNLQLMLQNLNVFQTIKD